MYTSLNFKTKKALKEAVAMGQQISVVELTPFGRQPFTQGTAYLEGPWYPEPHRWYAEAHVENGYIVKVK